MTGKVLVAYATKHGSTGEVAEAIAETLAGDGLTVDVEPAAQVESVEPYELVVLGGSIYMGRWHDDARKFLKRHGRSLAVRRLAVYGMGPLTLAAPDLATSRKQLDAALGKFPELEPASVAIFGGVVEPGKLRFPFSRMAASDARDWDAIRAWARALPEAAATIS